MKKFDVFVIGSGMAGITIANKCASKGLSVGITDELPYGGTCALRGCDPKKVLIGTTEIIESAKNLQGKGIEGVPTINWKKLMAFKQVFTQPKPLEIEKVYEKKGISTFHSPARFIDKDKLQVGETVIQADKIVLSTGATPRPLTIPGGELALTSTDFLDLDTLPSSLLFIGGGYIAFEFAQLAARCGAKVIIIERGDFPLKNFEQDIVEHLISATEKLGIKIVLQTEVTEIQKQNEGFKVIAQGNKGNTDFFAASVINSSGRVPAVFDLNLGKANVKFSKQGIEVNEYLQSVTNKHVYAAGDAANTIGLPLTPVAVMEGHIVASNIITGNKKQPVYNAMPTVVFTIPAMASVGLTEKEARLRNLNFKSTYKSVPDWFNAKRLNEEYYAFKTLTDKDSNKILGAHLIGSEVEETINLFAIAMNAGVKANEIKKMIMTYPSLSSDISAML